MQKLIVLSVQVLFDSSRYSFVIWKLLKMYVIYIESAVNIEYVDTFKCFGVILYSANALSQYGSFQIWKSAWTLLYHDLSFKIVHD